MVKVWGCFCGDKPHTLSIIVITAQHDVAFVNNRNLAYICGLLGHLIFERQGLVKKLRKTGVCFLHYRFVTGANRILRLPISIANFMGINKPDCKKCFKVDEYFFF